MAAEDGESSQAQVGQAALAFVRRYGWRFVTAERLVVRVRELLPEGAQDAEELRRLCRRAAGVELYAACERGALRITSVNERERAELAYADLQRYLRSIAVHLKAAEDAEDALQDALLAIRRHIGECKEPELFLQWSATILRRKVVDAGRAGRDEASFEELLEQPSGEARLHRAVQNAARVDAEGDVDFLTILHDCLRDDEQRLVALFVWVAGLKRRHFGELFDMPLWRYDRILNAARLALQKCLPLRDLLYGRSGGKP